MDIEGWETLAPEVREQCILKLRDMTHLRDEAAQSSAVDANALMDKLNRVERPRSASPSDSFVTPPPLGPEEQLEEDRRREKESHEALIKDNGRPCYQIELEFDVSDNPGQYKEILECWEGWRGTGQQGKLIFSAQLWEWQEYRSQQRIGGGNTGWTATYICVRTWPQSKLEDWMEYQDYELRDYEGLEEGLKEAQERLTSKRRTLAEEGYSAFEEIEDIEFGKSFGMTRDWGSKDGKAKTKQELAERKLSVAKTRLEAANSEELGEMIERGRWIGWFEKEEIWRQTRKDQLETVADDAKQDVVPYEQWFVARRREFDAKYGEYYRDSDEGRHLFAAEVKTADYWTKLHKRKELRTRAHEASSAHFWARKEAEYAKEVLEVARTEDLALIVERAALIRRIEKEVRFAEFHVEEEKGSTKVLDLKIRVISDLISITNLKRKKKRLKVLLDWTEQQRRNLVGDASTRRSEVDHPAQKRVRQQKMTKSLLDSVDPAKFSKTSKQSRKSRRKASVLNDILQAVEKPNVDSSTTELKSDRAVPIKNEMRARLRSVHSSRISKPTSRRFTGR